MPCWSTMICMAARNRSEHGKSPAFADGALHNVLCLLDPGFGNAEVAFLIRAESPGRAEHHALVIEVHRDLAAGMEPLRFCRELFRAALDGCGVEGLPPALKRLGIQAAVVAGGEDPLIAVIRDRLFFDRPHAAEVSGVDRNGSADRGLGAAVDRGDFVLRVVPDLQPVGFRQRPQRRVSGAVKIRNSGFERKSKPK